MIFNISESTSIVIEENFDSLQIFRLTANFCHVDRVDILSQGASVLNRVIGSSIAQKFVKLHEAKQVEKSWHHTIESKFTLTVEVKYDVEAYSHGCYKWQKEEIKFFGK